MGVAYQTRLDPIDSPAHRGHARPRHVLLAVTVGNMLEWYDFAVYGFLTSVIAKVMFPADDPTASLLLSVGAFGVGFLTRPVGALVFGALADRKGRKLALLLTFGLMGAATFAIGLIPSFAVIGIAAPLLVVLARLLQGLAAGGAIGGATAMLTEHAPPGRAGFFASWQGGPPTGRAVVGSFGGRNRLGARVARAFERLGLARAILRQCGDRSAGTVHPQARRRSGGVRTPARPIVAHAAPVADT